MMITEGGKPKRFLRSAPWTEEDALIRDKVRRPMFGSVFDAVHDHQYDVDDQVVMAEFERLRQQGLSPQARLRVHRMRRLWDVGERNGDG